MTLILRREGYPCAFTTEQKKEIEEYQILIYSCSILGWEPPSPLGTMFNNAKRAEGRVMCWSDNIILDQSALVRSCEMSTKGQSDGDHGHGCSDVGNSYERCGFYLLDSLRDSSSALQ